MYITDGFTYDGVHCDTYNLKLIHVGGGFCENPFGISRDLKSTQIKDIIQLHGFDNKPLEFELTIGKIDYTDLEWTLENRKQIAKWLFKNQFKPLTFDDNPNIVYYCLPIDGQRIDNFLTHGYAKIKFKCNAPYPFLNKAVSTFDFRNISSKTIIEIENESNISDIYPDVEFTLHGTTGFTIKNLSNEGKEFKFTGLNNGETISVDNRRKYIKTSLGDKVYRYSKFNKEWLKLKQGINRLEISDNCTVAIRYQCPIII